MYYAIRWFKCKLEPSKTLEILKYCDTSRDLLKKYFHLKSNGVCNKGIFFLKYGWGELNRCKFFCIKYRYVWFCKSDGCISGIWVTRHTTVLTFTDIHFWQKRMLHAKTCVSIFAFFLLQKEIFRSSAWKILDNNKALDLIFYLILIFEGRSIVFTNTLIGWNSLHVLIQKSISGF